MRGVQIRSASLLRPADEVASLFTLLAPGERSRATMFFNERDRRRFIVSRSTLRILLGEKTGISADRISLCTLPGGKPAFVDVQMRRDLHFNVTHCGELALFAFADREIGVDIERLAPFPGMSSVAAHFFSGAEAAEFERLAGMDATRFFFRTWVRKEAYVKATGMGLSIEPSTLTVGDATGDVTIDHPGGTRVVDHDYVVHDFDGIDDHAAAVAQARS